MSMPQFSCLLTCPTGQKCNPSVLIKFVMFTLLSEKYLATFAFLSQRNVMSACSALRLLCVCVWSGFSGFRIGWPGISFHPNGRHVIKKTFLNALLKLNEPPLIHVLLQSFVKYNLLYVFNKAKTFIKSVCYYHSLLHIPIYYYHHQSEYTLKYLASHSSSFFIALLRLHYSSYSCSDLFQCGVSSPAFHARGWHYNQTRHMFAHESEIHRV